MDEEIQYEAGYKKPPKASRFKKGQSGNPSGRPRRSPGVGEVFRKVMNRKVKTNGPNGQKWMTKFEASITQLANKSVFGDVAATKLLLHTAIKFPELITGPPGVKLIELSFVGPDADKLDLPMLKPPLSDE